VVGMTGGLEIEETQGVFIHKGSVFQKKREFILRQA